MNKDLIKLGYLKLLTDRDLFDLFLITIGLADEIDIKIENEEDRFYFNILKDDKLLELGVDNEKSRMYISNGNLDKVKNGIISWEAIIEKINNNKKKSKKH